MRVTVISPAKAVFDGDAEAVVAPAFDGKVGILPRHAPFMTILGDGELRITRTEGDEVFDVSGGFLQVIDNTVRVVAEHAEAQETVGG